jgi:hypothetical protein
MRLAQNGKEAIGRSRGGLSTKFHIAADATGRPLRIVLTAGQVHEATQASIPIEGLTPFENDCFHTVLWRSRGRSDDPAFVPTSGRDRL